MIGSVENVFELASAARALTDEFGGDVPDWLREAVGRLERALEPFDDMLDDGAD